MIGFNWLFSKSNSFDSILNDALKAQTELKDKKERLLQNQRMQEEALVKELFPSLKPSESVVDAEYAKALQEVCRKINYYTWAKNDFMILGANKGLKAQWVKAFHHVAASGVMYWLVGQDLYGRIDATEEKSVLLYVKAVIQLFNEGKSDQEITKEMIIATAKRLKSPAEARITQNQETQTEEALNEEAQVSVKP